MSKQSPSMDQWLQEAKQHDSAPKVGMYLSHNGVVRQSARARVRQGDETAAPVTGMLFRYDQAKVDELENAEELTGKDQKKLETYQENQPVYEAIIAALNAAVSEQIYNSPAAFMPVLTKALSTVTADKKLLEKIREKTITASSMTREKRRRFCCSEWISTPCSLSISIRKMQPARDPRE